MNADAWMLAASVSQVVASIAVIVTIPFAVMQIRQATRSRYLEALSRIFDEFHSESFFRDRRFVYSHEPFRWDACTDDERMRIERLINAYNRISFLVEKGMVSRNLILELWSGALFASWQKLELYVRDRRAATGFSDWAVQFEHLAALANQYRAKALGEKGVQYQVRYPTADSSQSRTQEQ